MKNLLIATLFIFANASFAFVEIDSKAPNFELTDTFGKEISHDSFIGKKVVLEWTNHDCPFVAKHYKTTNIQSTQELAKNEEVIWLSIIFGPGTQGYVTRDEANELTVSRKTHQLMSFLTLLEKPELLYNAKPHLICML